MSSAHYIVTDFSQQNDSVELTIDSSDDEGKNLRY